MGGETGRGVSGALEGRGRTGDRALEDEAEQGAGPQGEEVEQRAG